MPCIPPNKGWLLLLSWTGAEKGEEYPIKISLRSLMMLSWEPPVKSVQASLEGTNQYLGSQDLQFHYRVLLPCMSILLQFYFLLLPRTMINKYNLGLTRHPRKIFLWKFYLTLFCWCFNCTEYGELSLNIYSSAFTELKYFYEINFVHKCNMSW